ncbi:MAG: M20/M25/M40 family metallo-hydrolase [Chloroflexi bacterium]|nr:M20/M25/M40 family metallo-hydrolase [Chloroflexota bacterium]
MDTFKLLKTLCETDAPSGYEAQIAPIVQELWEPYTDAVTTDRVGSLIAIKHGRAPEPRPRLLLAAHMDEIGLMVTQVVEQGGNGFLRVTNVGGIDRRQVYAQLVTVHGRKELPGVIGCLPPHLLPDDRSDKAYGYEDLVIDLGLPLAEVAANVAIGDYVSFRQPLRKLLGQRVSGKALDNRASVAAVTICLEYLHGRTHDWDVVAVATAQEETRLLGAYTSAFSQRPDAAIAIDVTFGKGPATNDENTFELGSGPTLDIGPNVHPGIYKALQEAAESLEMNVNTGTHSRYSGTDAFGLQIARDGIPTGLVGIPLRYMHTVVESVDIKDVERTGRLLGEFIIRLDTEFIPKITAAMMEEDKS